MIELGSFRFVDLFACTEECLSDEIFLSWGAENRQRQKPEEKTRGPRTTHHNDIRKGTHL